MQESRGSSGRDVGGRWPTLEAIRAFALLWIFLVHLIERIFGGWYIANPDNDWPSLVERIAQLDPIAGYGIWDVPLWLLVSFGRAGDQGVQLFIILSGFGLTWALQRNRGDGIRWRDFWMRRLSRIYPQYWLAHLLVAVRAFVVSAPLQSDSTFLFSLLGIRFTPGLLYAVSPPWWYIGLIIQLYLVFPPLWTLLQRLGWRRFLLVTLVVSLAVRTVGLWIFADVVPQWGYLDAWARGAIFVTRLPEFVFGMALAAVAAEISPERLTALLCAPGTVLVAAGGYVLAMLLSAFLLGNGVAVFLLGTCAFVLLFALLQATVVRSIAATRAVRFLADHSYAIFLVHFSVITAVIPRDAAITPRLLPLGVVAFAATILLALLLDFATSQVRHAARAVGRLPRARKWRLAGAVAAAWLLLVGAELWVRDHHPQEVNGWGERPSLQEDPRFGWRLLPNRTTRLRWLDYDYRVTSNALGFPGPLYPAERSAGTLRVMTIGDAFTSGEGVDSDAAWPRLLEQALAERPKGRLVQVQNFGITGYGPNQYVAVARAYLPVFRPDVLLVTMFVNEFEDATTSDGQFRQSIGFGSTPADSLYATLTLGHLSVWMQNELRGAVWHLRGRPSPMEAAHAQLQAFRSGGEPDDPRAKELVRLRLAELRDLAATNGARLILLLVPANVQVCSRDDLFDRPDRVDLSQFDLQRPQRVFAEQSEALSIEAIDLRPVLRDGACPYRRHNMHWTEDGHRRVAAFVAKLLEEEKPD